MAETKTAAKGNQSEGEFFAVVGTGRAGVSDMLEKMGGEIQAISAPNVGKSFDVWKARALIEIANRDELKDVLQTRPGIFSVYKALTKCATLGLQIGGQFPHAYFVPKEGKAMLVVTAEGYAFAAVHGPGAVLAAVPKLEHVYDKDKLIVNGAEGTVKHDFAPFGDRGKLVGYYMILEYKDEHREVATITRAEVEKVSEGYSTKTFSSGKEAPAWKKSAEAMYDKIASKQLLKKPTKEAEGLAMLLGLDEYDTPEYTPPPRDIEDRMGSRLDEAARDVTGSAEESEEPEGEPEPEGEKPEKGLF